MSELKSRSFTVELRRDHVKRPWGIRITGGCDVGTPLIVTRAQFGTPSDGILKPGDKIRKIADYDARDIRHQDAQNLFHNAGNTIKLVIQRDAPVTSGLSGNSSRASSVGPSGTKSPLDSPYIMGKLNTALLDSVNNRNSVVVSPHRQEIVEEIHAVTEQPYRTTPLVLPGAKVKKDAAPTESYLRHHPNPAMRAPPPNTLYPHDVVMKQKVADSVISRIVGEDPSGKQVVHKQFNTPIGLYSDQNIKDTIQSQTGIAPNFKKTVVYDPAKSETYKALQEAELGDQIQEVTVPVQTKVFSPVKASTPKIPPTKRTQPQKESVKQVPKQVPHIPHPVPGPHAHLNSLGVSNEEIQQSNSFKRLMYMVMNDN
ncbi:PDZ_signaling and DUF4749 domain-containing protein Zasp66 isoform X3 [Lycorma delicatula]|uniref:PDZ_signaling and DUF4749 domain-containing protein Zasp66 isoform X3 n=1 Tax=Lycorma delicatula TaxID=130591 RepID=UPI003F50E71C